MFSLTDIQFSSPREEALEIACQTRKNILLGNNDAANILRSCLVIANDLHKLEIINWINQELNGYSTEEEVQPYREQSCVVTIYPVEEQEGFRDFKIRMTAHQLTHFLKMKETIRVRLGSEKGDEYSDMQRVLHITPDRISIVLASVVDRCLNFLNETINELQYGGVVEFLMEEIRRNTDEKLATYNPKIAEETRSLFLNLTSTNPADWSKVGHSCRKILKFLADSVFPPSKEKYKAKDNRILNISDPCYINRLYAFIDTNCLTDERRFMGVQLEYLEDYLRKTAEYSQKVEHNASVEKYHADMLAIHTYLVISNIFRHVQKA